MPGPITKPNLNALDHSLRQRLINECNRQPLDVLLHYLQTKEIKLQELVGIDNARKTELSKQYEAWLKSPDPAEQAAWDGIFPSLNNEFEKPEDILNRIIEYINQFPQSTHNNELRQKAQTFCSKIWEIINSQLVEGNLSKMEDVAQKMRFFISSYKSLINMDTYKTELSNLEEEIAKERLRPISQDYDALLVEIRKYQAGTAMFRTIHDLMWNFILNNFSKKLLERFLHDVPETCHAQVIMQTLRYIDNWENIKDENTKNEQRILQVVEFVQNIENSILPQVIKKQIGDFLKIEDYLKKLIDLEINIMKSNPAAYDRDKMLVLVRKNIIPKEKLIELGLITNESYEKSQKAQDFLENNPIGDIEFVDSAELETDDITDVYLFGVPSTGKTCVLMGLLGSEKFLWNNAIAAGEYGDILERYRYNMILPTRTLGEQFFCIHGSVEDKKGKKHLINMIELAGEQFLDKIAMNPDKELSLRDMATVAAPAFQNGHRKIIFIVIDPTVETIKYTPKEKLPDGTTIEKEPIDVKQENITQKIISILANDKNKNIMKQVDALHFIATKYDVIESMDKNILDCLQPYLKHIKTAIEFCQPKKYQINEATNYRPQLYTFSLGKFYVGGTFKYNSTDSDKLMNVIAENTLAIRDVSFVEKMLDTFLNKKLF